MIGRRAVLASPALLGAGCASAQVPPPIPQAAAGPGLHARAAAKGLMFGAALNTGQLAEPDTTAAIRAECGLLVAEYEMKWDQVEPNRGDRRFRLPDRLMEFARVNRMAMRGHTLVWHESDPPWMGRLDARALANAMQDHIEATVGRWRGRIGTWDVVNEAVRAEDGRVDWLRRTRMLEVLGPDYIPAAFRAARAADPAARLAYNDFGCEHATVAARRKRMGVLALLRGLKRAGAPVDVLGVQAHLQAGQPFAADEWQDFLSDVAELGLTIEVTELDMNDRALPADVAARDAGSADLVRRFLEATLAQRAVRAVVTWGLSDRHSWVHAGRLPEHRRRDSARARPLPLDDAMRRKPMWHAIAIALDGAPSRA